MNKLAFTALTTVALTNLASADRGKELKWNQEIIDTLLKDEQLVKNYGTVGYPLADELDPGWACESGTTLYELNVPLYEQEVAKLPFTAGVGGELRLVADDTKVGAELELGPTVEMFKNTYRPVDITFGAFTRDDGTSDLSYSVNAFGYTLTTQTIASTSSPIADSRQFGYSLPATATAAIGDSFGCPAVCDYVGWEAHANVLAHVGGMLSFSAATSGVEAHALLSAVSWGEVGGSVSAWEGGDEYAGPSIDARLDVIRLLFAARAQLLPQSGGSWVAGAASRLWLDDTMGAFVEVNEIPLIGTATLFKLEPMNFEKEREFSCKFENKMKVKGGDKK